MLQEGAVVHIPQGDKEVSVPDRRRCGRHMQTKTGEDENGESFELCNERNSGNNSNLFYQCSPGKSGGHCQCGHQCSDGFDIRNPWISWAAGTLRARILQTFVDFLQKAFFCVLPIAILAGCGYNSFTT